MNLPKTIITFIIFTGYAVTVHLQGEIGLSVSQAITSLAALNLLSMPLATLLYAIPQGWAALGCFERNQQFLLQPSRIDQRTFAFIAATDTISPSDRERFELEEMDWVRENKISVGVGVGTFGWSDVSPRVVKVDISIEISSGLTILVGPVGSGK